uniref:Helicase-associated domain-containing protein n=1 Tax=Emiliania huxleyi TaxID=2903 RepID=A0A6V2T870_EMIHU
MTEASYHGLPAHNPPEMQRCSLAAVTLQLKALGIQNVLRFDFLSPPPPESLSRALELLFALGALTEAGELTQPIGDRMARLPLEPQLAAMLLAAEEEACVEEAAAVAALLSVQSVFTVSRAKELEAARAPFAVYEGDSVTLLNVHRRFLRQLKRHGSARAGSWCRRHRLNERVLERCSHVKAQLLRQLARRSCCASSRGWESHLAARRSGQTSVGRAAA